MAILNNSNAISAGGYDINNSLRFRSSASAYLNRTPASAGNRRTFTYSAWVKIGTISTWKKMLSVWNANTDAGYFDFGINNNNNFVIQGWNTAWRISTQVFRDPSAWYHIVVAVDTTQATAANRIKLYVNGNEVTVFSSSSNPTQNYDFLLNSTVATYIGTDAGGVGTSNFDGYQAEINFIDGSAKTPSDFGETDTTTGVWKPKAYTGTYGTNGFYLKFSDIATTSGSNAGLGKDFSGNTNYWTTNNISVTSGTTYDAMKDSPTLTSATVANYCVMNPLNKDTSITVTDGNLAASAAGTNIGVTGSIAISSGKWYWEITQTAGGVATSNIVGITDATLAAKTAGLTTNSYGYGTGTTAYKWNAGTNTAYGSNWTNGDVISVAFDADAGTITFYKNNVSQGTAFTGISGTFYPAFGFQNGSAYAVNFGQRPFSYTPPTGFVRLNTYNLPDSTIKKGNTVMDATLYTGNGTSQTITTASSFKPDLVWIKGRSYADFHTWFDTVRGATKSISSDLTTAEVTRTTALTAFTSTGFTVGSDTLVNYNAQTIVAWQWQAGQGSTSSNTSGNVTSTVSVNATAGFSIVTYTGTGASATVGHGLGVAPKFIIVKKRSAADPWVTYHVSLGVQYYTIINETSASYNNLANYWSATAPSSTVFGLNSYGGNNQSAATYVAYCWAEIEGFSKFGSYTGNGSTDGPFVYLGFRPKYVMIKRTNTTGSWLILDSARETYNPEDYALYANLTDTESFLSAGGLDFVSNGFKLRGTDSNINASGSTMIYAAFAENPFRNSLAR